MAATCQEGMETRNPSLHPRSRSIQGSLHFSSHTRPQPTEMWMSPGTIRREVSFVKRSDCPRQVGLNIFNVFPVDARSRLQRAKSSKFSITSVASARTASNVISMSRK